VRTFVTGGAGFIGGHVAQQLRERGDAVVAAVREPRRAEALIAIGCELIPSDLSNARQLELAMRGTDAVLHLAGAYRVGIAARERPAMYDSNVGATERVLDAAIAASVPRVVYVSTINAFGNTRGRIVDETYRRDPADGFVSWYDETKYLAHQAAEARIAHGAPVLIMLPGGVYGRGDHSQLGAQLRQAFEGTLQYRALSDVGVAFVHVEDVAAGIVRALDGGRTGQAYVLGGQIGRLDDGLEVAARLGGKTLPNLTIPTALLRVVAPAAPLFAPVMGLPPNFREVISASDSVTYWASDAKARSELGYAPVDLETGLRRTFAASA
jgi:nucleoside-diphosphate-sugar epimerase